jgi:hypothetical protein
MARTASTKPILQTKSRVEDSEAEAWKGVCNSGCYRAKSDKKKCKCKCRGRLHGKAHVKNIEEMKIDRIANQSDQE